MAKVTQVERLGLTALGSVPYVADASDEAGRLVMLNDRYSAAAEAYRVLRTNLQFASVDRPLKLVQVSSPNIGEGKSMTAANLAIAIAQLGQTVILVDGDLHQPTQHRYFQVLNNVGVTTALLGNLDQVDKMFKPTAIPNLHLLPSGPLPPNPAELLGSKRMQELLESLKQKADIVVIDSPPMTVISDAVVLATRDRRGIDRFPLGQDTLGKCTQCSQCPQAGACYECWAQCSTARAASRRTITIAIAPTTESSRSTAMPRRRRLTAPSSAPGGPKTSNPPAAD